MFLSCAFISVKAQLNFVLNGSFEQHINCPYEADQIKYAHYWNSIDTSWSPGDIILPSHCGCYPEYINICGTGICTAPNGSGFYQNPRSGNGMAQSEVYYDYGIAGLDEYNYLQGKLSNHLTIGQSYCVTFFVNKENYTSYSINKIGAYLDDGTIDTCHNCDVPQTQYTPQILDTTIVSDTFGWVKIQGSFIAIGTEKFITIGDFFDTGNVNKIAYSGVGYTGLYLFDDVSVIASDAVAYGGADTAIRPSDTAHIGAIMNGDGMPCWWYVLGSSTAIDSGGTINVHPSVTTTYVVKMDLCGNITYDTVKVVVWPSLIMNYELGMMNVRIYPNPATNEVSIDGAAGCVVVFYDVTGSEVLKSECGERRAMINIEALANGIYFVEVVDRVTRERVVRKILKE